MSTNTETNAAPVAWAALLNEAVNKPGAILAAYSAFHNYSMGNQMLAYWQCAIRGLNVGPINTYKGWLGLGRHVRKGEKAIELCMPVTFRAKGEKAEQAADKPAADGEQGKTFMRFIFRRNWFVLCQTDGPEQSELFPSDKPAAIPFDVEQALTALSITREEFSHVDGNVQGYAKPGRVLSVSPLAALPHKTMFHEIAHIVLGHLENGAIVDGEHLDRSLREVEAESTAYLLISVLGMDGAEFSRGYIQHWLAGAEIPERSAQRIFKAADTILKAGKLAAEAAEVAAA